MAYITLSKGTPLVPQAQGGKGGEPQAQAQLSQSHRRGLEGWCREEKGGGGQRRKGETERAASALVNCRRAPAGGKDS